MRDLTHFQEVAGLLAFRRSAGETGSMRTEAFLAHLRCIEKEILQDRPERAPEDRYPSSRQDPY